MPTARWTCDDFGSTERIRCWPHGGQPRIVLLETNETGENSMNGFASRIRCVRWLLSCAASFFRAEFARARSTHLAVRGAMLVVATLTWSQPWAQTTHYPDASVCANFSDPREPGTMPTFPGLWVNTNRAGDYWHINYLNHPDPRVAFTWMTFEQGRPVWYQSASTVWNAPHGTGRFQLKRFGAEYEPVNPLLPDGLQRLRPLNDEGEPAFELTARVVPNDPSLLAISWRRIGTDTWNDECIHDASRVGPFFLPSQQPSVVNPNASFTGLYYEPELAGYGVAWTILQVPQPSSPSTYLEAVHLLTFDDNGAPTWFEARQCVPTTTLPPAVRDAGNQLELRVPLSSNTGSSSCPSSGESPGVSAGYVRRQAISPSRVDMSLWLQAPSATQLKRPSPHFPAAPPPQGQDPLADSHVRLVKLTATNQIVLDRAACVVHTAQGQTSCPISLNWGAELPSDNSLKNFRVEAVALHQGSLIEHISDDLVGETVRNLPAGSRWQFRMIADRNSGSGAPTQILDRTVEVRGVSDTELPLVEIDAPAACEPEHPDTCIVHAVNTAQTPMQVRIAASSGLGIARVELYEGNDVGSLTPLCGTQGCSFNASSQHYVHSGWYKSTPGTYTLWARAYTQEGNLVSPLVKHVVQFGTPPAVELLLIGQNGQESPTKIGTHDTVRLRAHAPDPGVLQPGQPPVEIRKIEFLRFDDGVESEIGEITPTGSMESPYILEWQPPRNAGSVVLRARATDSQGSSGVSSLSNAVPVIIESPSSSLTVATYGSGILTTGQFPATERSAFETGEPGAFLRTRPGNPHNFTRIWFRLQRGSETPIDVTACTGQEQCNRGDLHLQWVPAANQTGSYNVRAMGTLVNATEVVSGETRTIAVTSRASRSVALSEPAPGSIIVFDADDGQELISFSRLMQPWAHSEHGIQMRRWPCVGVVREADVSSVSGHQCEQDGGLRQLALPVGRCGTRMDAGTTECLSHGSFSVSAADLCPFGVEACVKEQDLVLVAHSAHDGFLRSPANSPVRIRIPYATFLSDADVPATMAPGALQRIKVIFRNSGGTDWTPSDYRLRPVPGPSGQSWGVAEGIAPTSIVAKQSTVTFEFDITAPQTAGQFAVQWQLHRKRGVVWDAFGQLSVAREIEVRRAEPLSAVVDQAPASVPNPIAAHDPTIGSVAGQASVSGGAAAYEIPIVVPPGRRGMQPQLALAYNSRNGNGAVGVGWSLSGLSSIHRCPRTIAQDEYSKAVSFTADDALCLDGQRLVALVEGAYGDADAEYRTEIESYQKIVQRGGDLQSPATYFDVYTRAGELIVYGPGERGAGSAATDAVVRPTATADAPPGMTLSWLIAHRQDPVGNNVSYHYATHAAGETLLSEVRYTGFNQPNGTRRVRLTYADRPDTSRAYMAKRLTQQTKRLERIETIVDDARVREYSLAYTRGDGSTDPTQAGTGRSLLESVTECAADVFNTMVCRTPTEFAWDKGGPLYSFEAPAELNPLGALLHEYLGEFNSSVRLDSAADFDGDGSRDLFWIGPTSETETTPRARIMTLTPERKRKSIIDVTFDSAYVSQLTPTANLGLADFDRDGRPELLGGDGANHVLYFWRNDPVPGEVPISLDAVFVGVPTNIPGIGQVRQIGDVNGDGMPDVVKEEMHGYCPGINRIVVYLYTGFDEGTGTHTFDGSDGFPLRSHCQTINTGPQVLRSQVLERIADFDGDGIPDFWLRAGEHHEGHEIRLARVNPGMSMQNRYVIEAAASLGSLRLPSSPPSNDLDAQEVHKEATAFWLDVNGDGLDDWLYPVNLNASNHPENRQPRWALRLNLGGVFGARKVFGGVVADSGLHARECHTSTDDGSCAERWVPWRTDRIRGMDFDSDGRQDLLVPTSYAGRVCTLRYEKVVDTQLEPCDPGSVLPEPEFNQPTIGLPGVGQQPRKYPFVYPAGATPQPTPTGNESGSCEYRYYCPEPMRDHPQLGYQRGELETKSISGAHSGAVKLRNQYGEVDSEESGAVSPTVRSDRFLGLYETGGVDDFSSYHVAALRFVEVGGELELVVVPQTGIVLGNSSFDVGQDVYGDGSGDVITKAACYERHVRPNLSDGCGKPQSFWPEGDTSSLRQFVETSDRLPSDLPLMTPAVMVNMNYGAAVGAFGLPAPVDLMTGVVDGEGNATTWSYAPLGAKAGRTGTQAPLYSRAFPKPDAVPYTDQDHIYFTSSMPVVAEMHSTIGLGGPTRRHRYGYVEAMYHLEGRGFQGFHGIVEEDVDAGTRVTTTFHQKYPLTGRIEQVTMDVVGATGLSSRLSLEDWVWSCDPLDLSAKSGCASDVERAAPYLASKTTRSYAAKAVPDGSASPLSSERIEVTAHVTDAFCSNGIVPSGAAGIDAYGNVTHAASVVFDRGPDSALAGQCERTVSLFEAPRNATGTSRADTTWWIDELTSRTTTQRVAYTGNFATMSADSKTVQTTFDWNDDRTLHRSTVAPVSENAAADIEATVTTVFHPYTAHGLPKKTTVQFRERLPGAATHSAAERTSEVTYEPTGYFPALLENALEQVTTVSHRAADGQLAHTRDPNGIEATTHYDAFGLPTETVVSKQGETHLLAHPVAIRRARPSAATSVSCPAGTAWVSTQVQAGAPSQSACHDAVGRVRRQTTQLAAGIASKVDTEYDARGLLLKQTEPFSGTEAAYSTQFGGYDFAGRPGFKLVDKPNLSTGNAHGDLRTDYTYAGRTTTITVKGTSGGTTPVGVLTMSRIQDSLGRYVETRDAATPTAGVTRFWHDAQGNVSAIRDAKQVMTTATYDALGRRIEVVDPNQGTWRFEYNGLGELTRQTDARGLTTTLPHDGETEYAYDALGRTTLRITSAHDVDGTATSELSHLRTRDTFVFDTEAIGALSSQRRDYLAANATPDASALRSERAETYTYDALARRTAATIEQWRSGNATPHTVTLGWKYDANNGWLSGRHWNGEEGLRYGYDAHGQLASIGDGADATKAYWTRTALDLRGQVTAFTLGDDEMNASRQTVAKPGSGWASPIDWVRRRAVRCCASTATNTTSSAICRSRPSSAARAKPTSTTRCIA
jgi:YD repeat-containing protein